MNAGWSPGDFQLRPGVVLVGACGLGVPWTLSFCWQEVTGTSSSRSGGRWGFQRCRGGPGTPEQDLQPKQTVQEAGSQWRP